MPLLGFHELDAFATSAAIGLLMGAERERRPSAKAGLRTFALIALLGTSLCLLGEKIGIAWLPVVGLVLVGVMLIAVYATSPISDDPGTTTVVAALLCYSLSVMVWFDLAQLAVMLAIGATVLLYFKSELRGVTLKLEREELISILQFGVVSLVVLPLLPDRNYGPYDALNPRQIWLMVVLISGVSLAGYIALKFVGQRYGAWLLGLFGGLVSSTATTLVYARHARTSPDATRLAAPVIVIANVIVFARIAVIVGVAAPSLIVAVLPALAGGLVVGAAGSALLWRRLNHDTPPPMPEVHNPAAIRASLVFGCMYGLVLLAAAWLRHATGETGLYWLAFVSGLTDVDAITLSSLRLEDLGQIGADNVRTVIVLAIFANNVFKFAMAFFTGGRRLALRCAIPMAATMAGMGIGWLFPI
ncbi:MAG: DUF4010 domain-containing protein [Betaproteobacteria bacterium]|nr:DUF4010 domain-containing protein [Betaproteobacteria bacterium]